MSMLQIISDLKLLTELKNADGVEGKYKIMKRFKTTVTRTDEYIIELDDSVLDEQWMEEFRQVFFDFDTYEEHAEQIAQMRARIGEGFIEGYGMVKVNGKLPWFVSSEEKAKRKPCEDAVNIEVISEDQDCEVEVEEI